MRYRPKSLTFAIFLLPIPQTCCASPAQSTVSTEIINSFTSSESPIGFDPATLSLYLNSLREVGENLANHPELISQDFPKIEDIQHPRSLGPFFEGLLPRGWKSDEIEKRLNLLDPLMDDAWMSAAQNCGAYDLYFQILIHRGQLQQQLLAHQESGDEIAIIRLGETLRSSPAAVRGIDSEALSTRTLALLLSGAFGISNRIDEESILSCPPRLFGKTPIQN